MREDRGMGDGRTGGQVKGAGGQARQVSGGTRWPWRQVRGDR